MHLPCLQGGLDAVTGPGYLAAAERAAQAVQSYRTSEAARQSANPSVSVVVHPLGSDPHLQGHGMPATGTAAGYSGGTHFGQAGGFNATLPPPPQLGTGIPAPAGTPLPGMPLHMSSGAGRSGTLGSAQMATSTGGGQAGTAPAQIRMGPGSMTHGSVVASGRVQGSSRVGSAAGTGPARPKWGSGGGAAGSKQGVHIDCTAYVA